MYKIISTDSHVECQDRINELESDGFKLVHFSFAMSGYYERDYTAVMHKSDTTPAQFITANDFLAAMDASVEIMQSMADHADEVLRDEARQHGCGQ